MSSDRTSWPGIAFGLSLLVLAAYQQLKLPPTLPVLLDLYGYNRILAGGFMSIYAVCGLLLSVRLGTLMQRHGAARFLQAAFLLFVLAAILMMLWPESGLLFLLGRTAEGIAFAVLAIAGPAICNANAGKQGLSVSAAVIATWIPLGGLAANIVAAAGGDQFGWRLLWWVGIAATAVMALWSYRVTGRRKIRLGGHATAVAAPAPDTEGLWRAMTLSAALFMLWSLQMFAYLTWLPDYLVQAHGVSPRHAVLLYMMPVGIVALFNLVAAPLLRAGIPVASLLATMAGIQATIWFLLPALSGPAAGILALVVYAMAAGITPTCLFALPATIFGVEHAGARAFGVLMTGRNMGVLAGPVLIGTIVDRTGGWSLASPVLGCAGIVLTLGAVALHGRLRRLAR